MADISIDPSSSRTLRSNLSPDDILALNGNTDQSDKDGFGGGIAPEHQQGHRFGPEPRLLCNLWW